MGSGINSYTITKVVVAIDGTLDAQRVENWHHLLPLHHHADCKGKK